MNKFDTIIIGGGPSGMLAAGIAAKNGKSVALFEKNEKLGRKLKITGKGRCNVCNDCDIDTFLKSVPTNSKFLYSAIHAFTPEDTVNFFKDLGVNLKTERGNRVFPVSDNSDDIVNALANFAKRNGVKIIQQNVQKILHDDTTVKGVISNSTEYYSDSVLLATGGVSYKATGSTGDGHKFAKNLGHTITELKPSLIALTSDDTACSDMQGLSLKNSALKLFMNNKKIYDDFGEMIFTHFGVSGPMILSASAHMHKKGDYHIVLDLKPALSFEQLDKRLVKDFESTKNFSNYLKELLPQKMINVITSRTGIDPTTKCNEITRVQRHALITELKNFKIDITGFRPINEAIITSGGVSVKEINPKTMESKLVKGLFFAGEIIDVDAYTGGFNLQIAYSTAYLAGNNL